MILNAQDQTALIKFHDCHKANDIYEMITTEQALIVKEYPTPPVKKSIAGQQHFRSEVKKSKSEIYHVLRYPECFSFDQSYYLRMLGNIQVQSKIEKKHGLNQSAVYSGAGFGALQAIWAAFGWASEDLSVFARTKLRNAIRRGPLKAGAVKLSDFAMGVKTNKLPTGKIEKLFKKTFSENGRPLKMQDLKSDVFLPIQDISGVTRVITKQSQPKAAIWEVLSACVFDPVFFDVKKKYSSGMGILKGAVAKNNDQFIRKNNPSLKITSIGSPERCFDKTGQNRPSDEMIVKSILSDKYGKDLEISSSIEGNYMRFECAPLDEFEQFATSDKAIEAAMRSADRVEV